MLHGLHADLRLFFWGVEAACAAVFLMGMMLVLNALTPWFGSVSTNEQWLFLSMGAVFVGVGVWGAVYSARLFWRNSAIVKQGNTHTVRFQIRHEERSESASFFVSVSQGPWRGKYLILPTKALRGALAEKDISGELFADHRGHVAAFVFERHLLWVYGSTGRKT